MKTNREIESFIKNFVIDLKEKNVAVFAGAGMSKSAGFVDWPELLRDIADELGLSVDKEYDLISLAQYHVNERGGRGGINKKILQEFSEAAEVTENHKILSRLPIPTYWTTNYDTLIEDSLKEGNKVADIKYETAQLANIRPKRDAVVYKMHGDVQHPGNAVITKRDYEVYYKSHEAFVAALSGDLISKTFLFIGFSFSDPNLNYVLSRLNIQFGDNGRHHYCFIKKQTRVKDEDEEIFKYRLRKQELLINDLKRYKIIALEVEEYSDITDILREIENRFRKSTTFISGSAEEYGSWDRNAAQRFIHMLSKQLISADFRIVNGFGWGVGSAVINGALEAVYEKPEKYSEDQLVMKPFPQFETGEKKLPQLWEEYRYRMIALSGIALILFGNKRDKDGAVVPANGVMREFEIAMELGLIPIPIGATGYIAEEVYQLVMKDPDKYYHGLEWMIPLVKDLSADAMDPEEIIKKVVTIIQTINR